MSRPSSRTVMAVVLAVALVIAGVVSHFASSSPDGLTSVATRLGFAGQQRGPGGGPLAGYEVSGLDHPGWSGGVAGVLGCLVVLAVSTLLFRLHRSASVRAGRGAE